VAQQVTHKPTLERIAGSRALGPAAQLGRYASDANTLVENSRA